jgi:hypothetical protein
VVPEDLGISIHSSQRNIQQSGMSVQTMEPAPGGRSRGAIISYSITNLMKRKKATRVQLTRSDRNVFGGEWTREMHVMRSHLAAFF